MLESGLKSTSQSDEVLQARARCELKFTEPTNTIVVHQSNKLPTVVPVILSTVNETFFERGELIILIIWVRFICRIILFWCLFILSSMYSVPHIQDFTSRLAGCHIFSKSRPHPGYHQIPAADEDIPKTTVITPFGLFESLVMPFGLKNLAQAFQRLMDQVCQDMDFLFCYLDDILIASRDAKEHEEHLRKLFTCLSLRSCAESHQMWIWRQRNTLYRPSNQPQRSGPVTIEGHRSHGVSVTKDGTKPPRVYRHGKFLLLFHSTGCRQTAPFIHRHPTTETRPSMDCGARHCFPGMQESASGSPIASSPMHKRTHLTHHRRPRMQQPVPSSHSM